MAPPAIGNPRLEHPRGRFTRLARVPARQPERRCEFACRGKQSEPMRNPLDLTIGLRRALGFHEFRD
jgi:hypothetical protein